MRNEAELFREMMAVVIENDGSQNTAKQTAPRASATRFGMKTTRFQRVAKRLQLVRQVVFEISDARRIHRQVVWQLFLRRSGFLWQEKRETNGWFFFCQGSNKHASQNFCNTSVVAG